MSRQLSSSHIQPRSLSGYQDFFRQNSNPEGGWLEIKIGAGHGIDKAAATDWERSWVAFEDWLLSFSDQPGGTNPKLSIPMGDVVSFRTDNASGKYDILITTTEYKIKLRCPDADEVNKWLFCFQKSVALVYTHLLSDAGAKSKTGARVGDSSADRGGLYVGTNTGSSIEGAGRERGNSGDDSISSQGTRQLRRTSMDAGPGQSENGAGLLMGSGASASRAIRGIESGVGINGDYLVNRTIPAFSRQDSVNQESNDLHRPIGVGSNTIANNANTNSSSGSSTSNDNSFPMSLQQRRRNSLPENVEFNVGPGDDFNAEKSTFGVSSIGTGITNSAASGVNNEFAGKPLTRIREAESSNNLLRHMSSSNASLDVSPHTSHQHSPAISREGSSANWLVPNQNNQNNAGTGNEKGSYYEVGIAMSPAIPIFMNEHNQASAGGGTLLPGGALRKSFDQQNQLAGSYEEDQVSVLAKAIEVLDNADARRGDHSSDEEYWDKVSDSDNGNGSGDNDDDDAGEMMFDLEESESNMSSPQHSSKSSPAATRGGSNMSSNVTSANKDEDKRDRQRSSDNANMSPATVLRNLAELENASGHNDGSSNSNSFSLTWTSGSCTKLGPRNSQEDRLVAINDLRIQKGSLSGPNSQPNSRGASPVVGLGLGEPAIHSNSIGYFGVYDGHCGNQAAQYLQDNLHHRLYKHPHFADDITHAIDDTMKCIDHDFLNECTAKRIYCGTTCLAVMIRNNQLIIFNVGDCQAVLGKKDGSSRELLQPHSPGRPDEEARIKAAKGWITEEKELYMGRLHRMDLSDPVVRDKAQKVSWVTIHRVCGELAVSRSIGDPDYKRFTPNEKVDALFNWPEGHDESFAADLVIPNPDVEILDITPDDEFFIIACDGLWDVVSPVEATTRIYEKLKQGVTPTEAAEHLCELALKLGSSDNVSIVIVKLQHPAANAAAILNSSVDDC